MIAPYQYVLSIPEEPEEDEKYTMLAVFEKLLSPSLKTGESSAEKFAMESMKTVIPDTESEGNHSLWKFPKTVAMWIRSCLQMVY